MNDETPASADDRCAGMLAITHHAWAPSSAKATTATIKRFRARTESRITSEHHRINAGGASTNRNTAIE